MSRYTSWSDVVRRYPKTSTVSEAEATAMEAAFISGAEAEVDARLARVYTVPFASTPTLAPSIIVDIATDLAYYKIWFLKLEEEQAQRLRDDIDRRLDALACGSMTIVTSGTGIPSVGAWGTHKTFPNITGVDSVESWRVSDLEADAQEDKRDL